MRLLKWMILLLPVITLQAVGVPESIPLTPQNKGELQPWFTGSLLSVAGRTIPPGHVNLEPYFFVTGYTGSYNNHWKSLSQPRFVSLTPLMFLSFGLTKNMDLTLIPNMFLNFREHSSQASFGDFPIQLGFQALIDKRNSWMPDLRMIVKAIFPTGPYQQLNPKKHRMIPTGSGSYQGGFALNFQKMFYFGIKLLRMRWNFNYLIPSSVHVKGFNTYGGGYGTSGKITPGQVFFSILSFEYTFSQHWIGALDIKYALQSSTRFSGNPGVTASGVEAKLSSPSTQQISLAPAIEYAFNRQIGLIFGPWFTIAGKNSAQFISGVIALNYYY